MKEYKVRLEGCETHPSIIEGFNTMYLEDGKELGCKDYYIHTGVDDMVFEFTKIYCYSPKQKKEIYAVVVGNITNCIFKDPRSKLHIIRYDPEDGGVVSFALPLHFTEEMCKKFKIFLE